jgi:hypothetical protein
MKTAAELFVVGLFIISLAFTGMECDSRRRMDDLRTYRACREMCGGSGVETINPGNLYRQCVCRN